MLKTGEERIIAVKVSRLHPPSYAVSFLLAYIVPVPDERPQSWRVVQGDGAGGKGFVKSIPLRFPPPMPLIHFILAFFPRSRQLFHELSFHSARISVYLACLSTGGLLFPHGGLP